MKSCKYIMFFLFLMTVSAPVYLFAGTDHSKTLWFEENKGQWPESVLFRLRIPGGLAWFEAEGIKYVFYNQKDINKIHELHHGEGHYSETEPLTVEGHCFFVAFDNSSKTKVNGTSRAPFFTNYFTGSDPSKWASKVSSFNEIRYAELYPGIDLRVYEEKGGLKYDFEIKPHADPAAIKMVYHGTDGLEIRKKQLLVKYSFGELTESKPYIYQNLPLEKKEVAGRFVINQNQVSFQISDEFDASIPLIIDPALIFASFSGSTADNWGYTATYDETGHLYAGGIAFAMGYPTTTGAFQTTFGGGTSSLGCDISISKFSPDGTSLLYSTYLGGDENEAPHSIVVNSRNELIVLGTSSSLNYPVSSNAAFPVFIGGSNIVADWVTYTNGTDIILTKFDSTGSALLGSTFVGGTGNDGLNFSNALSYNYADPFRGEVIVDDQDNILVATTTGSSDFSVTAGAPQMTYAGGNQDACVFKMSSDLSSMIWGTYLGGSGDDAAYGVQYNSSLEAYFAGGTTSTDFPTTAGVISPDSIGGVDGFIAHLDFNGTTILASSYIGTTDYDQNYFVQIDFSDNVYVCGQTEGNYPITPATVYNVPFSGQFIHKMTPDLDSTIFSTAFGTGSGGVDIALSAFLVNDCDHIYVSGWGGFVNQFNGGPASSTTTGLPVSSSALQSTTDGSDFYLIVLAEDADSLMYATYFGGNISREHVDGGTSRFDKHGIVYQAVCGGCGGSSDFPTTPSAWSNSNNSSNCNIACFKIDLSQLTSDVNSNVPPYICVPDSVTFQNNSNGGTNYFWDFGDGTTSTEFSPTHTFVDTGLFNVMLIITDSLSCTLTDTDYVSIRGLAPPQGFVNPTLPICPGDTLMLSGGGGSSSDWYPVSLIQSSNSANTLAWADSSQTFIFVTGDSCGADTILHFVEVFEDPSSIIQDTGICVGNNIGLWVNGGGTYLWSPPVGLSSVTSANPVANPSQTVNYTVNITDTNQCEWLQNITLFVDTALPQTYAGPDTLICIYDSVNIEASGGLSYFWQQTGNVTSPNSQQTKAFSNQDMWFVVNITNGCGARKDSLYLQVHEILTAHVPDGEVCYNDTFQLWANGGINYIWTPVNKVNDPNISDPVAVLGQSTDFIVHILDTLGCRDTGFVHVEVLPLPEIDAGEDLTVNWASNNFMQVIPGSPGVYKWEPDSFLSCSDCPNPVVTPLKNINYTVIFTDTNGCTNLDTVDFIVSGILWVPNTFTPNADGINDVFYARGSELTGFEMHIFNRWGDLIFTSDDINKGWDGTVDGRIAIMDTYVWKIYWQEQAGSKHYEIGHVNLVR